MFTQRDVTDGYIYWLALQCTVERLLQENITMVDYRCYMIQGPEKKTPENALPAQLPTLCYMGKTPSLCEKTTISVRPMDLPPSQYQRCALHHQTTVLDLTIPFSFFRLNLSSGMIQPLFVFALRFSPS